MSVNVTEKDEASNYFTRLADGFGLRLDPQIVDSGESGTAPQDARND